MAFRSGGRPVHLSYKFNLTSGLTLPLGLFCLQLLLYCLRSDLNVHVLHLFTYIVPVVSWLCWTLVPVFWQLVTAGSAWMTNLLDNGVFL